MFKRQKNLFNYIHRPKEKQGIWRKINCKRLRSQGIDTKEAIPLGYVAWRAGTSNRFVVTACQAGNRFLGFLKGLQIRALDGMKTGQRGSKDFLKVSIEPEKRGQQKLQKTVSKKMEGERTVLYVIVHCTV